MSECENLEYLTFPCILYFSLVVRIFHIYFTYLVFCILQRFKTTESNWTKSFKIISLSITIPRRTIWIMKWNIFISCFKYVPVWKTFLSFKDQWNTKINLVDTSYRKNTIKRILNVDRAYVIVSNKFKWNISAMPNIFNIRQNPKRNRLPFKIIVQTCQLSHVREKHYTENFN